MNSQPVTCLKCDAALAPGMQFCERCGNPVDNDAAPPRVQGSSITGGFQPAGAMRDYPGDDPLMSFEIAYPESLSRWMLFVKWLLVIPHLVVFLLLGVAFFVAVGIAWLAILITGRIPRGIWNFELQYMRRSANLTTFATTYQRDEYPPFGNAPYAARLDLEYPERLSRWKIFFKWLLVIPNLVVLAFVLVAALVAVVVAWVLILITGKYPRALFDFVTGAYRWGHRFGAYFYLMTDRYPPFSLE